MTAPGSLAVRPQVSNEVTKTLGELLTDRRRSAPGLAALQSKPARHVDDFRSTAHKGGTKGFCMLDLMYPALLVGAGLIIVSVLTSLLAFRIGAPLLLIFLSIGLIAGEDGLGIEFDNAALAYMVGSTALAVILFDSGFGTKLSSFRTAAGPAITLATVGVLLTAGLTGTAVHFIFDAGWLEGLLLGAIVSSTDAAAVFFLLRVGGIRIRERVRSALEIESGSNDPMAVFLTLALVELIRSGAGLRELTSQFLLGFGQQMGLGLLFGLAGGYLIVRLVNRFTFEPGLYPIIVLGAALGLFALTGMLGGSGFLAAYVAGLYAGNQRLRGIAALRRFQEGATWLAQIVMFLTLGLLATPSEFPAVTLQAISIGMLLIFVCRPLAVWLCLAPFRFPSEEVTFVSWVGLRGAVSILLAITPLAAGLPNGQIYFNAVFMIVLISLLIQGWTIKPMARQLNLIVPSEIGPLEKVELELPGQSHHELVVYRVEPESPVGRGERIPRWAHPSLIVRDGASMRYQHAGRIQPGDYVYLFVAPRYTRLLDRLFASPAEVHPEDEEFFGAFAIDPTRPIGEVVKAYDARIGRADPDTSVGEFIAQRLGGHCEVGDRISLGEIELVVRKVGDSGTVLEAGLALPHQPVIAAARSPLLRSLYEIGQLMRSWRMIPRGPPSE